MAKPLKIRKAAPPDPAPKTAARIMKTRLEEFFVHWPDPDQIPTPEELHDLRISGKRLRYSAESLREMYPDRLALLIELLKSGQDLLGTIQDIATQRAIISTDLARIRRRNPRSTEVAVLENLLADYDAQRDKLFVKMTDIWRGMRKKEFRRSLEAMTANPSDV